MSFAIDLLAAARQQTLQTLVTAQQQLNDIDAALASLVTETVPVEPETVARFDPPTPPLETYVAAAQEAVQFVPPWEQPAETGIEDGGDPGVVPVVPFPAEPEKKSGRRTNEELAADAGVRLEDVKTWLGGERVTKAKIEEFAQLHPAAAVADQTPAESAETPFVEDAEGFAEPMPVETIGTDAPIDWVSPF